MWSKNVETFIGCDCDFEESEIVIFGAPFDSTTSYRPGTRFASREMRAESFGIETYSPYQDRDLCRDAKVFDSGDLELPFGDAAAALKQIEDFTSEILSCGKLPFMIGGEHLVTLGAFRAALLKYPNINILHFDAHADLRDDYLGVQLSHASVIKRCYDLIGDGRIFQFGIRSGEKTEFEFARRHTFINKFNFNGLRETLEALKGKPIYFTLDLDVLDPSVFPGTGTPEAGGVSFNELLEAIFAVCSSSNLVACDITELSPAYDRSGCSTAAACKILREILLIIKNGGMAKWERF